MAQSVNSLGVYAKIPVTIAAGQSLSGPVAVGDAAIVAVEIPNPNGWVTAQLTFQAATDVGAIGSATPGSPDPTQANYNSIVDRTGTEYTVKVSSTGALSSGVGNGVFVSLSGGSQTLGLAFVDGAKYIKVRSGVAATPVVQTNAQTINLIVKTY